MLTLILLSLALLLVVSFLPGSYLARQVGPTTQMGPRDNLPEPTVELGRARRALANLQETLPIFLTLGILSIIYNEQGLLSIAGGVVYLVGRVAHVVCYIGGFSPWRSLAYSVATLGLLAMAFPLVF